MKTKLISLLICMAVNSYAENTIPTLPDGELTTGIHDATNNVKMIGSAPVNSVNSSDVGATMKGVVRILSGMFPNFKRAGDGITGLIDIIGANGKGGGNSGLSLVHNQLNIISNQINQLQDSIIDFNVQYNMNELKKQTTLINKEIDLINNDTNSVENTLKPYNDNIFDFLAKNQKDTNPIQLVLKINSLQNDIKKSINQLVNANELKDYVNKLSLILNQKSRPDKPVNYIGLFEFYNLQYINGMTQTIGVLIKARQLDYMIYDLISSDSKYKDIYQSYLFITVPGVSVKYTAEVNRKIIKDYYDTLISGVLSNFPQEKIYDIYSQIGLKFNKNSAFDGKYTDINLFSSLTSLTFNDYDGYKIIGNYGGETAFTSWESSNFNIPYDVIENSMIFSYSDKSIPAYSNTAASRYWGATELFYLPSFMNKAHYDGGVGFYYHNNDNYYGGRSENYSDVYNKKNNRIHELVNSTNNTYVPISSQFAFSNLKLVYQYGDTSNYQDSNNTLKVDKNQILFTKPHGNSLVNANHLLPQITGIYSITLTSPLDNRKKLYTFGINYHAWNTSWMKKNSGTYFDTYSYGIELGWGATVFCPAFNCKQLKAGYIIFPDGVSIQLVMQNNKPTIDIKKNSWIKYSFTSEFPKEFKYTYTNPKISDIGSGSHDLIPGTSSTFFDPNEIDKMRFTYAMIDDTENRTDHPSFTISIKDATVSKPACINYHTSHNKNMQTCVYPIDKAKGQYKILTKAN